MAAFREEASGLLHVIVESRLQTDKQAELSPQDMADLGAPPLSNIRSSASIMRGVYIHPEAASLLKLNDVQGLMMDTTWSVMQDYVTSILIAVRNNTVIPFASSFGPTESHQLYDQFHRTFKEMGK
jgi:hypothetical protein